jgi:hypothetical protein
LNWKKNPATSSRQITSFTLVHEAGNKYIGLLEYADNGSSESQQVNVIYDGRRWMANFLPQIPSFPSNPPIQPQSLPISAMPPRFNPPKPAAGCPLCGGTLVRMDAGERGKAFGGGNLLGAFMKTHRCNCCGHLV